MTAYNIKRTIEQGCAPGGLQDLGMWQGLVNMVNERIECRPLDATGIWSPKPDPVPFPQTGDDIQNNPAYYILAMQTALRDILPYFSNHTLTKDIETTHGSDLVFWGDTPNEFIPSGGFFDTPAGTPDTGSGVAPMIRASWNFETIRAAAVDMLPPIPTPTGLVPENITVGILFRRFRPREILTDGDETDVQGNDAASGQVAFNAGDYGRPYVCSVGRSGVAHWRRNETLPVDVLDSCAAAPAAVVNPLSSGDHGLIRVGDYIRLENLEEIRQIANMLREVWHDSHTDGFLTSAFTAYNTSYRIASYGCTAPTSNAGNPAGLASAYAAYTPVTRDIHTAAAADYVVIDYESDQRPSGTPTSWTLTALCRSADVTISAATIRHEVRWFGFICSSIMGTGPLSYGSTSDTGPPQRFRSIDAQGETGVVDLKYHRFYRRGSSVDDSENNKFLDDSNLPPDRPAYIDIADTPHNLTVRYLGWTCTDIVVLVNYIQGLKYQF